MSLHKDVFNPKGVAQTCAEFNYPYNTEISTVYKKRYFYFRRYFFAKNLFEL